MPRRAAGPRAAGLAQAAPPGRGLQGLSPGSLPSDTLVGSENELRGFRVAGEGERKVREKRKRGRVCVKREECRRG